MGVINYTDQLRYTGKGYLDSKMMPVEMVSDLYKIPVAQRFEGLTITVLRDDNGNTNPHDYWLVGGITNSKWIKKTVSGNHNNLKLVLEEGFLKLMDGSEQLGEGINLNNFFPSQPDEPGEMPEDGNDMYISSVEYVTVDDRGENGVFLCFTYSDDTKKYLDMSRFLGQVYEEGSGIVINGNVISLDAAILGRIEYLEKTVSDNTSRIEAIQERLKEIDDLSTQLNQNKEITESNTERIGVLEEQVKSLTGGVEGSIPDGKTIGLNDESALCVKVSSGEHNMLSIENDGLYAIIPIYYGDEELNNIDK